MGLAQPPTRRAVAAGLLALAAHPARAQTPQADMLMTASYQTGRFAHARFNAKLVLSTRGGADRVRQLRGAGKLLEKGAASARLMRIEGPADMRGVATLTVERQAAADDLWVYLPSLRRVRRLVSSNRRDPWMGSEFSFGDIVGHEVADWRHAILRRERIGGGACTLVESLPIRPGLASETGYSRRLSWIRDADLVPARAQFFDLAGGLLKTMTTAEVRTLAPGKAQALQIAMRNERSGAVSRLDFADFRIDVTVADSEVAPGALKS
ncbi:outer membrane lipoprotein-sorting protein [Phenylobacterium sp.]|uniref:outer membrane lipoprotein-sorting protein n=1 Tax=Phenylobacterium sp. TaxID=1871053 RepID=UPI002FCCA20D